MRRGTNSVPDRGPRRYLAAAGGRRLGRSLLLLSRRLRLLLLLLRRRLRLRLLLLHRSGLGLGLGLHHLV